MAWYRFYRLDTLGKITDIPVGGDYVDDDSAVAAATKGMDGTSLRSGKARGASPL